MSWERQNYSTNNYTYSDNENQSFVKILFLPWSTLYFEHLEIVNESASKARHLYCLQKRWRPFRTCNVPYITSTLADTILNASVDNIWSHLIEHIWPFWHDSSATLWNSNIESFCSSIKFIKNVTEPIKIDCLSMCCKMLLLPNQS